MTLADGLRRMLSALAAATALQGWPAMACGLHGGMVDLAAAHPRSIAVALAVRDAIDSAALRSLPALPPSLGLVRAGWLLRTLSARVPALSGASQGTIAVLLVDSGLWARFAVDGAGSLDEMHASGPKPGEPAIITSEATLSALLDGTLTAENAFALGVIVVSTAGDA